MSEQILFLINQISSLFDKSWNYARKSFSQEGEDIVLANYLGSKDGGFYVDVGAHHPFRFSNTYFFYKKGWRGINIDANPGSMKLFEKYRSRDINIEKPISNNNSKVKYFIFDEPALNTFSVHLSSYRHTKTSYKIKKEIYLKPVKLSEILDKYLPKDTQIDFISIDVEGCEDQVLLSNNWSKYKPSFILVEILETKLKNIMKSKTYKFLQEKGYEIVGVTGRSVIFQKK